MSGGASTRRVARTGDRSEDAVMRSVLVLAVLALAAPRDAHACFEPGFEQHHLDRSQLADTTKPGPVSVTMWIEEPGGGGCVGPAANTCGTSGRRLVVRVTASDDQTPPDKLGFRVTVSAGTAPFPEPGDVRALDELLSFPLGESESLDFELAVRAIDLNGNIGPATYTQVAQSSGGEGCASHHAGRAVSFGLVAIVLAFLVARRRR